MLRELQVIQGKPANTMYKAGADMVVGMAVQKKMDTKEAVFASAQAANGIFFVDKERVASGSGSAKLYASDYDEDFMTVKTGDFVKLVHYQPGEVFATDQIDFAGLKVGDRVAVGTDGKLTKATTAKSRFVYLGELVEGSHKLGLIEVGTDEKTA